jgi:hypothetical protein
MAWGCGVVMDRTPGKTVTEVRSRLAGMCGKPLPGRAQGRCKGPGGSDVKKKQMEVRHGGREASQARVEMRSGWRMDLPGPGVRVKVPFVGFKS